MLIFAYLFDKMQMSTVLLHGVLILFDVLNSIWASSFSVKTFWQSSQWKYALSEICFSTVPAMYEIVEIWNISNK